MAAGLATLRQLEAAAGVHSHLEELGRFLDEGFASLGARLGIPMQWNRVGGMGSLFFSEIPVTDWSAAASSRARFNCFFHGLPTEGIHLPPSPFETWFWSYAHTLSDMERTLRAAEAVITRKDFTGT